jgi:DNA-3-methyladenine glycosylase II
MIILPARYTKSMEEVMQRAADHLTANDPVLALVIERAGLCAIRPRKDYYQKVVESIIGQQLSVKAAASIRRRFIELFGGKFPSPDQILVAEHSDLRGVGLSNAKVTYVKDLAQHVIDGRLEFEKFNDMSNDEIIAELTAVKGVGEWTAHMFLMFAMVRLNILPTGDLGIRTGMRDLYGLATLPSPEQMHEIARKNNWHPYESIASWYIWHAKDNAPS